MTDNTFRPVPPARLAAAFSAALLAELGAQRLAIVVERNRTEQDPRICHSHDLCDANMVMEAAWTGLGLTGEDGPDVADDEQTELWNRAWEHAKRLNFDIQSEGIYSTEFPPEFHPSTDEIERLRAAGLGDTSWHNDECPSWSWHVPEYPPYTAHAGEVTVTMFVDAPDPDEREAESAPRFQVGYGPCFSMEPNAALAWLYEGDDLDTAIAIGRDAHEEILAGIRRRAPLKA